MSNPEEGDIQLGPINSGQTMAMMAFTVRAVVATFLRPEDTDEEKTKLSLILFSIFLQQYISVAIKPEVYAPILEIMIKEVCNAIPSTTPVE